MTVENQEIKPPFSIFVPSRTKSGVPIPEDILQNFINVIIDKFTRHNGGCFAIPNVNGYFLSDTGKIMEEPNIIIKSTGDFPFSDDEMSLWAKQLDQECIRVEKAGLVEAYHYDGEIEHIYNFKIKTNIGSVEYCIDINPKQYVYHGEDEETEVFDIPEKYVIIYDCYDEDGQHTLGGELDENDIIRQMSEPECDTATYLLFQCLLKQLNILNSR